MIAFKLEMKHYEDMSPCLATCRSVAMIHMHVCNIRMYTKCFTM